MAEPVSSAYFADVSAGLTVSAIGMLGSQLRKSIEGTSRQQALKRCYQAATMALLPEDDPVSEQYRPIMRAYLALPAVNAEMAKLIKGREPDKNTLIEVFDDEFGHREDLPAFDFPVRLAASIEAFVDVAESEPDLADTIQTAQQRDVAKDVRKIREAVARLPMIEVPSDAPSHIEQAAKQLDSSSKATRMDAIETLKQSTHAEARETLAKAVSHDIQDVRLKATLSFIQTNHSGLLSIEDERAIPGLFELALEGEAGEDRILAINALVDGNMDNVTFTLLDILHNKNDSIEMRRYAAEMLAQLKDPDTLEPILDLLCDAGENRTIRACAAKTLGEIGDTKAVPHLIDLLKDWMNLTRQMKKEASRALGRIGQQQEDSAKARIVSQLITALNDSPSRYAGNLFAEALSGIDTEEALAAIREWENQTPGQSMIVEDKGRDVAT